MQCISIRTAEDLAVKVTIVKWGNSQGIRLSTQILHQLGTAVGESLTVSIADHTLVLRPERPSRYSLDELIAGISKDNRHDAIETGPAVGKKAW